jgi:hypothetical protein
MDEDEISTRLRDVEEKVDDLTRLFIMAALVGKAVRVERCRYYGVDISEDAVGVVVRIGKWNDVEVRIQDGDTHIIHISKIKEVIYG